MVSMYPVKTISAAPLAYLGKSSVRVGVGEFHGIKIGAKLVSHGRYVTFQLGEVAVSRQMFADNLSLIARPSAPPKR